MNIYSTLKTTSIESDHLKINDDIIEIGSLDTANDKGIIFKYDGKTGFMGFNYNNSRFHGYLEIVVFP